MSSFITELRGSIYVKFFNAAIAEPILKEAWDVYTARLATGSEADAKKDARTRRDQLMAARIGDQVALPPNPDLPRGWTKGTKLHNAVHHLSQYAHKLPVERSISNSETATMTWHVGNLTKVQVRLRLTQQQMRRTVR